jgi:dinuclear metal center YbgI/SA1388 family protein
MTFVADASKKRAIVSNILLVFPIFVAKFHFEMQIKELLDALERFAPLPLQDGFDNAGLQIGLTEVEATGALLCLDVTEAVVDEAIRVGCNLIVSHHPLLFRPLKCISGHSYIDRCLMKAIKNDIVIYSAHTNLDNARGGVNYKIAEKLGLTDVGILEPKAGESEAGSGIIGRFSQPISEAELLQRLKERFTVGCVRHNELTGRQVERVALCGGAGAFLLKNAIEAGADAFITGEIHYHDYFGHEGEILMAEIGHYESEQYTSEILFDILSEKDRGLKLLKSKINTNPIKYY